MALRLSTRTVMRASCWALVCASFCFAPAVVQQADAASAKKAKAKSKAAPDPVLPETLYKVDVVVPASSMHGIHGLAFGPDGGLYAASLTGHSLYRIDVKSGAVSTFVPPPRGTADDLAFNADGAVAWTAGSFASVFMRGNDGKIKTVAQEMPGVNAVNFTKDGRLFFTRIFGGDGLYEADVTGASPPRVVAEKIGGLNAFQIAADNSLYGPLFFRGKVVKVNIETGEMTDVATGFMTPSAVKIEADGHLIVLDYNKGDVVRVDPKTGEKETLATLPPPIDNLAIAKDGTIYVSSTAFNGITAIHPKTHETRRVTWGGLSAPGMITTVETGETQQILAADSWGPRTIDPKSGTITPIKRGPGVAGATSIAVQGDTYVLGNIWPQGVVQIIERESGKSIAMLTNFGAPYDIKPMSDGFLVADYAVGRLTKVANDEAHTRTTLSWGFDGPVGLADAGKGIFYVSEYTSGQITRVDTANNERTVVISHLKKPEGIALAPDGRLIVAEVGKKRIIAVDVTNGSANVLANDLAIGLDVGPQVPGPFLPTGVTVARDGAIYVSGDIDNTLYRLTAP